MLSFFLSIICTTSIAQENSAPYKNSIAFISGIGIPFSNFGNVNLGNENAGMAKTGFMFELNFQHKIKEDISFSILYRTQFNQIDKEGIIEYLKQSNLSQIYKISVDSWEMNNIMLGINSFHSLDPSGTFSLLFQLYAGISIATFPNIEVNYSTNNYQDFHSISNTHIYGTSESLCVLLGAGLKYQCSERLSFLLESDVFYSNHIFNKKYVQGYSPKTGRTFSKFTYSQTVSILAINAGVAFLF